VLISEDGEVGEVPQVMVALEEAKTRPEMPGWSSQLRKVVGAGSLWQLPTTALRGSRTGIPSDDGDARSWLQLEAVAGAPMNGMVGSRATQR
jgi:hypothetical protein